MTMRMPTLLPFGEGRVSGEAIDTRTRSIRRGSGHGKLERWFGKPTTIRTLQRKLYRKAKAEPAFRFYLLRQDSPRGHPATRRWPEQMRVRRAGTE